MSAVLEVQDLQIAFGGVKAVDGLTFSANSNEIVAVIGPNGAGKTSAFNCITGFYKPTGGRVTLGGVDITGKRPADIAQVGVSRTFQNLRLFHDMTVLDNVRAGMHLYGGQNFLDAIFHTPRFKRSEALYTEEAHPGSTSWASGATGAVRPATSPTGSRSRSRSPGSRPQAELLLLDEPAAGLNHGEKQGLLDLCRRIRASWAPPSS